jgi:hypothetical protein
LAHGAVEGGEGCLHLAEGHSEALGDVRMDRQEAGPGTLVARLALRGELDEGRAPVVRIRDPGERPPLRQSADVGRGRRRRDRQQLGEPARGYRAGVVQGAVQGELVGGQARGRERLVEQRLGGARDQPDIEQQPLRVRRHVSITHRPYPLTRILRDRTICHSSTIS